MSEENLASAPRHTHPTGRDLVRWWREGARTALFRAPAWDGLATTPVIVVLLVAAPYLVGVLLGRLYVIGDATFYWPAILAGWLPTVATVWACWLLAPRAPGAAATPPGAAALFSMLAAQTLTIEVITGCVLVPLVRAKAFAGAGFGLYVTWGAWFAVLAWLVAAQSTLLWRSRARPPATRIAVILGLVALTAFGEWAQPPTFWYPAERSERDAAAQPLRLTQEVVEVQQAILPKQLQSLAPQQPGVVDVYAITYAPYADEDVFRRESSMVAGVLEQRFGASGRTIQLVNHRDTIEELPWATALNMRRTIDRMATLMDRDEDVLFIHLTSHGASDGVLSTRLWPFDFESLTPADLKRWLDEAHVRYRIVSVSACYSGSWIAPLAGDGTLVMTAADADHTSFGCGRGSELTFFGRAMFDEQLRKTWSFEDAHAAARVVIDERERAAGKRDGYSNPQISMGAAIKARLARLAVERSTAASR